MKVPEKYRHLYQKFMVEQYHIDTTGLMYNVNADGIEKLCIPNKTLANGESLYFVIYKEVHESNLYRHRGYASTLAAVQNRFKWPHMDKDIKSFYNACEHCQNEKVDRNKKKGLLINLETPLAPGQAYNIDYMTDLPRSLYMGLWYTMAMVIVDRCSLRCYILPCRKIDDAASAAELFFDRIVCDECNGVPLYLVSDRDTRFNNKFWQELHRKFGTQIRMSSARSQQTNGLAERTICVIEECLRSCINYKQDNWCELRSSIVLTLINQAPKTKLMNKSPMYYERGVNPLLPIDTVIALQSPGMRTQETAPTEVLERVQFLHDMHLVVRDLVRDAELKMASYANLRRRDADNFPLGTKVRLSLDGVNLNKFRFRPSKKLNPLWYGPFTVTGRPSPISCEINIPPDSYIHNVIPLSRLKLASDEQFSGLRPTPLPDGKEEEGVYELEKILDHDTKRDMFYCKWKNYSEIYGSTWEPRSHIQDTAGKLLANYEKANKLLGGGVKSVHPRPLEEGKTSSRKKSRKS